MNEFRHKEHEVVQDEPTCEMVMERKCNGVAGESTIKTNEIRSYLEILIIIFSFLS